MQIVLEVLYWLVRCSSGGGSYAQATQQQMHCFHSCYLLTFITFNYAAIQAFRNGGRFQPSNRGGHVQLRKKIHSQFHWIACVFCVSERTFVRIPLLFPNVENESDWSSGIIL